MSENSDQKMPRRDFYTQIKSQQWKVYVLLGVVFYFILVNQVIRLRPDHAFLALLVLAFLLGKDRAKRFLLDWLPFILFWIGYDMMRGVADQIRGEVNIFLLYIIELDIFGVFFNGTIPAWYYQTWQKLFEGSIIKAIFDVMGGLFYTLHFGLPLILGWIFWHTTDDRKMFYRFIWTMTLLNFSALVTFMIYPAAPPWYVLNYGFGQPPRTDFWGLGAGALVNVDKLIRKDLFLTLWGRFNPNHFAAVPSLHGAYPLAIAAFTYLKFRKKYWLMILYPLGVWFSAVYLNQHYIIDLFLGAAYLGIAYIISDRILIPRIFSRFIDWSPIRKTDGKNPDPGGDKTA